MEVLSLGKTSFKLEVPYKLFQTGKPGPKPLIVYLHGSGQNIKQFEKTTSSLHALEAYHLYIQGPYADTGSVKHRSEWGFRWYLYNGKQGSFIKSLEYTSEFIQGVIDSLAPMLNINRLCVLGYSMGGYQAGYFGLSRWKHTNDLIILNGRIKSESFAKSRYAKCTHMNIIGIHGKSDEIIPLESQRNSFETLKANGINCRLVEIEGKHKLTSAYIAEVLSVLKEIGYKN